jgi:hypothetical protein
MTSFILSVEQELKGFCGTLWFPNGISFVHGLPLMPAASDVTSKFKDRRGSGPDRRKFRPAQKDQNTNHWFRRKSDVGRRVGDTSFVLLPFNRRTNTFDRRTFE